MTEATQDPEAKGLPEGVSLEDTGDGKRGDGAPKAPEISNVPPKDDKDTNGDDAAKDSEKAKEEADKKAADEKAAKEEEGKKEEIEVPADYEDYGDDNANAIVEILKEANIPVTEAYDLFLESMQTGDFSKVDTTALVDKLGKAKADLVLLGAKSYYTTQTAAVKEIVDAVYTVAGNKENFDLVSAWAREKGKSDVAFQKQVDGYNQMFDLNATAAKSAAKELVALYEADEGNSSLIINKVDGTKASTTQDAGGDHISRADYIVELEAAYKKNDMHTVNRLNARRKSSLK